MDAAAFVDKWRRSRRTERSASQEHFLDLCEVLKHPKPGAVDPKGLTFTTERRVKKDGGKHGFADAWKKGYFGWEYKKKGGDLKEAYNQLLQYSGDLGNPPLLVVSDMDRIEIRTRFTDYPTTSHIITLDNFAWPANLEKLRCVFYEPERLRPEKSIEKITEEAAKKLAELAPGMRARFSDSTKLAHFLDRLIFCMFAEDVGLLPNHVFSQFLKKTNRDPRFINRDIAQLFEAMAKGGDFYGETVPHFNGNLFDDTPPLDLAGTDFSVLIEASSFDWSEMDPSIFGTLFERVMDPAQRSELGAHYTGYRDIASLVEPVVTTPLRREWTEVLEKIASLVPDVIEIGEGESLFRQVDESRIEAAQVLADTFLDRLRAVRVLDPACGSGNFLYVTLRILKDLEKEILVECRHRGLKDFELSVGPNQLFGIEINPYAFDLAQMTVWIGFIQWHKDNGFPIEHEPILQALQNFQMKDAIIDLASPDNPSEPDWPDVDFIVGNPPFLGGKKLRAELGDPYVDGLYSLWRDRVRPEADLCCYWFEKARRQIESRRCKRAGLLATQGIRGGANRRTLERIKQTGDIFFAVSDRDWVIDGANVHIALLGFDNGQETMRSLNGSPTGSINTNLTDNTDITKARQHFRSKGICVQGDKRIGPFDLTLAVARELLLAPNPHNRPSSDVIRPWVNGINLVQERKEMWIIDFEPETNHEQAALYESVYNYVKTHVYPVRSKNKRRARAERWWIHGDPQKAMRRAINPLSRFIATPCVSKHRLFAWLEEPTLPDCQLVVFARSDDYFFGVLHSRAHEVWALAQGTQVRERESGFRYTPTTCFDTFPFPIPTEAKQAKIAQAAKALNERRSNWLNPPEWIRQQTLDFPASVSGPWARHVKNPNAQGTGIVRYVRSVPKDAYVPDLAERTLTNLYNERPTWLDLAHKALDEAVFAAYGWDPSMTDEQILAALLALNLERSAISEPIASSTGDGPEEDKAG
jgi:type II restriction/modification system DNA methylase subunit YeeA